MTETVSRSLEGLPRDPEGGEKSWRGFRGYSLAGNKLTPGGIGESLAVLKESL
jgi:hypothetical protein